MGWRNWQATGHTGSAEVGDISSTAASRMLELSGFFEQIPTHNDLDLSRANAVPATGSVGMDAGVADEHTDALVPPPISVQKPTVTANVEQAHEARGGRKRRMKAADYFREILEPEHDK